MMNLQKRQSDFIKAKKIGAHKESEKLFVLFPRQQLNCEEGLMRMYHNSNNL